MEGLGVVEMHGIGVLKLWEYLGHVCFGCYAVFI